MRARTLCSFTVVWLMPFLLTGAKLNWHFLQQTGNKYNMTRTREILWPLTIILGFYCGVLHKNCLVVFGKVFRAHSLTLRPLLHIQFMYVSLWIFFSFLLFFSVIADTQTEKSRKKSFDNQNLNTCQTLWGARLRRIHRL